MNSGAVTRIIDFSPVDGPGNRMVVFLQGCNFNCWYCHNPETIPLDSGQEMTVRDILNRYMKAKPFISGVTFSGGECTVQFDFLLAACTALKEQGANILIDTNGNIGAGKLKQLFAVTDGLMVDMKAIDTEKHISLTGAVNEPVIRCIDLALQAGKLAEVRTVIRGNEPDALDTVAWVAQELVAVNPEIPYRIIRYRVHGVRKEMLPKLKPPSDELMLQCKALAERLGLRNVILV